MAEYITKKAAIKAVENAPIELPISASNVVSVVKNAEFIFGRTV